MGTSVLLLCELHFTSISCITFTALLDSHISFDHWYGLFRRPHEDILRIREDLLTNYSTGLIVKTLTDTTMMSFKKKKKRKNHYLSDPWGGGAEA